MRNKEVKGKYIQRREQSTQSFAEEMLCWAPLSFKRGEGGELENSSFVPLRLRLLIPLITKIPPNQGSDNTRRRKPPFRRRIYLRNLPVLQKVVIFRHDYFLVSKKMVCDPAARGILDPAFFFTLSVTRAK